MSVRSRLDVNVALNRPSYQSSIYWVGGTYAQPAYHANDGGNTTSMNQGSCINTESDLNPYWAVDLAVPLHVAGVKFTNRGDGWGTYTATLDLTLGIL